MHFDTPVVLTGSRVPDRGVARAAGHSCGHDVLVRANSPRRIGQPKAVRAVGRANGDNRLSIIVPCHRVIGADGALTGYGGGLARKQKLLDLERAPQYREHLMPPRSLVAAVDRSRRCGAARSCSCATRYPRMGPVPLAFARVALAALALLALAVAQRRVPDLRARWREFAVVGIVNSALPFVLFCLRRAIPRRRPPRAILNATSPFFGAIAAAIWLGEPLTGARSAA